MKYLVSLSHSTYTYTGIVCPHTYYLRPNSIVKDSGIVIEEEDECLYFVRGGDPGIF